MLQMIQIEIHPPLQTGEFAGGPDISKTIISLMTKPATLWTVAELGNLVSPMTIDEAKVFLASHATRH